MELAGEGHHRLVQSGDSPANHSLWHRSLGQTNDKKRLAQKSVDRWRLHMFPSQTTKVMECTESTEQPWFSVDTTTGQPFF